MVFFCYLPPRQKKKKVRLPPRLQCIHPLPLQRSTITTILPTLRFRDLSFFSLWECLKDSEGRYIDANKTTVWVCICLFACRCSGAQLFILGQSMSLCSGEVGLDNDNHNPHSAPFSHLSRQPLLAKGGDRHSRHTRRITQQQASQVSHASLRN